MIQYGKSEYWEERYKIDTEPFEFYQKFENIFSQIEQYLIEDSKILVVGCGNSRFSEQLYENGYQNITNIDNSHLVIKQMQEKYKDKNPSFIYQHMDVRELTFEDQQFDLIFDKALFDTLCCGDNAKKNINLAMTEISRVLKPGGVYCMISFAQQDQRLHYLEKEEFSWKVQVDKLAKPAFANSITLNAEDKDTLKFHFIYKSTKNGGPESEQKVELNSTDIQTTKQADQKALINKTKK